MKIAIVQMCSALDPKINLEKIDKLLSDANAKIGIDAVFLPEAFYSLSNGLERTPYVLAPGNEHYKNVQNLAIKYKTHLIGGSCATEIDGKILNRAYCFAPDGEEITHYDKIHLFRIDMKSQTKSTVIDEGRIYSAGKSPVICDVLSKKIGLSVCFDVRFSELYRYYQSQKVDLITIASAFTIPTGKAHWNTLVRARAIETQSFVIASAQWGQHNERISTYGHSMVVSPWGEVLADLGEGEKCQVLDLDFDEIPKVRGRVNIDSQIKL